MEYQNNIEFTCSEAKRTMSHIKIFHTSQVDYKWEYLEKVVNQLIAMAQDKTSKLEIADAALAQIEDMCNDPFDVEIAEKALQQIRE